MHIVEENNSTRPVNIRKSTYRRLTEREEEVVRRKNADQGTEQDAETARKCNVILLQEYYEFK